MSSLISILLSRFILALREGNASDATDTYSEMQDLVFARHTVGSCSDRLVEDFGSSLYIRGDGDDGEHEEELGLEDRRK